MALSESIPIDGDGVSTGTKVDEICAAIRTLRTSLNAGELDKIGGSTTGIEIDGAGIITLLGDSRVLQHIRVTAPSWRVGVTAPTTGFVGIFPIWAFDQATDDEVHYSLIVPWRIVTGSVINVDVDWCYEGAQDNGTVCWKLDYINVAVGETVDGSTTQITKTTPINQLTGKFIRTTLTTGITGAIAHDILGLHLWRDVSEDTLGTSAKLIQVHFEFQEDRLGKPI